MLFHRSFTLALIAGLLLVGCDTKHASTIPAGVSAIPPQALAEAGHLLRRVGFGPTPTSLQDVGQHGSAWYIEQQLDPQDLDESSSQPLATWMALLALPQSEQAQPKLAQLVERQIVRAIWSPRQLVESMTLFWEGHFNTNYWAVYNWSQNGEARATWLETRENELFRGHALGRFEDLLRASATSPTMLITLDNCDNVAGNPNENYARELVELFTMGVDNGYTQHDIEELARCFTGWGLCEVAPTDVDDPLAACAPAIGGASLAFHFDAAQHDNGPKTIFAGTDHELDLPARVGNAGLDDGFDVLHDVANLPQTAHFLCWKLARKFVADNPPDALVQACSAVWISSGGDLTQVLRCLFNSAEFKSVQNTWNKVETPFESLCSTVRALEGLATREIQLTNLRAILELKLHQSLFCWPTPDGFSEVGDEQLGTARMLGRVAFNQWIYLGAGDDIQFDIASLVRCNGAVAGNATSIVRALGRVLYQENFNAADEALALEFLGTDMNHAPLPLDPHAGDYAKRLQELAAFMASLPQGVEQ